MLYSSATLKYRTTKQYQEVKTSVGKATSALGQTRQVALRARAVRFPNPFATTVTMQRRSSAPEPTKSPRTHQDRGGSPSKILPTAVPFRCVVSETGIPNIPAGLTMDPPDLQHVPEGRKCRYAAGRSRSKSFLTPKALFKASQTHGPCLSWPPMTHVRRLQPSNSLRTCEPEHGNA